MQRAGKSFASRLLVSSLIALFLGTTSFVGAEGGVQYIPIWEEKDIEGKTWGCYTLPEIKELMKLDYDMQFQTSALQLYRTSNDSLFTSVDLTAQAHELCLNVVDRLDERLRAKQEVLEETTKSLSASEDRDILTVLPWIIAGSVLVTAIAFGTGAYLGHKHW